MSDPTDLYRYYDVDGRLLYVGISFSAFARAERHRRKAEWWGRAVTMKIEHHESRETALVAEARAIRNEMPIHNKALNGEQRRRLTATQTYCVDQVAEMTHLKRRTVEIEVERGSLYSTHESGEFTRRDVQAWLDRCVVVRPTEIAPTS